MVVSDTHIPARAQEVPRRIREAVEGEEVSYVIHAGDFTDARTLEYFKSLPGFVGVAGNMDCGEVRRDLPACNMLEVEGRRIGVTHGWGAPDPLPGLVREYLDKENPDAIVFGHSHRACNRELKGVLMFNPGTPTDTVMAPYLSYGVLEVEGEVLKGEIVRIS